MLKKHSPFIYILWLHHFFQLHAFKIIFFHYLYLTLLLKRNFSIGLMHDNVTSSKFTTKGYWLHNTTAYVVSVSPYLYLTLE